MFEISNELQIYRCGIVEGGKVWLKNSWLAQVKYLERVKITTEHV